MGMSATYQYLQRTLDQDLEAIRRHMDEMLSHAPLEDGLESLARQAVGNPGKMIRPTLMLMVVGDCPQDTRDELLCTAAAIEVSHTASLVLDDMVDGAKTRRGQPTVCAAHGADVALYVGLSLLLRAQEHVLACGYVRTGQTIARTVQLMCGGEMVQHANRNHTDVEESDYIAALRGKTAALFEQAFTLACQITQKEPAYTRDMGRLGQFIGVMFQIRDDLLDWTASEEQAGKPVNEDFATGIYTLPALYTFAQKDYGVRLQELAAKSQLTQEDLDEARRLVAESGGLAYARERLSQLASEAHDLIDIHTAGRQAKDLHRVIRLLEE